MIAVITHRPIVPAGAKRDHQRQEVLRLGMREAGMGQFLPPRDAIRP
jgi:hypothetical protein